MAEEEKVLVDEISNKALKQLKKTFEPTAEEKFEGKRIKAAMAGGGGGAGIAGAAAGMFGGKKGGGFFKSLGKWLTLPVIAMAVGIIKLGKGAWSMLTKMLKIIFWPIRWLLGMTGSPEVKAAGDVAKKAGKGGGLLKMFGVILKPFIWITTIWAGYQGWLKAADRDSDGVVSTYEKFLGGLEEMLKWLTLDFVDFSTFDRVKEKWAKFSFGKWVDDMEKTFSDFPDQLADWMDNKTQGMGAFVESFGNVLKEFLFGKGATGTTKATGGVMGWMAENLSADKVSSAIIGGIELAVAFGKMLVRIGMIALIGKDGKSGQPETWSKTSLFGFINQEIEPNLKPIAKNIGKTIMALLKWIDNIVGNVMMWVGDQLIAEGEAEGAGLVSQGIAKGIKLGRKRIAEAKAAKALKEAQKSVEEQEKYRIKREAIFGGPGVPMSVFEDAIRGKTDMDPGMTMGKWFIDAYGNLKERLTDRSGKATEKYPMTPSGGRTFYTQGEFGEIKKAPPTLVESILLKMFGGPAITFKPGLHPDLGEWGDMKTV